MYYRGEMTGKNFKEWMYNVVILSHPPLQPFHENMVNKFLIFNKYLITNWVLNGAIGKILETYKITELLGGKYSQMFYKNMLYCKVFIYLKPPLL